MYPVNDPRFALYFRQLLGQKGNTSLAQLPDVMPVMQLAGTRPEDDFLRGEDVFMANISAIAVAGQYSFAALEMALNQPFLTVIERLDLLTGTCGFGFLPPVIVGGAGGSRPFRDTRIVGAVSGLNATCQTNVSGGAAVGPTLPGGQPLINAPAYNVAPPLVLGPGGRFLVEQQTINQALSVNVYWREVPLPPR